MKKGYVWLVIIEKTTNGERGEDILGVFDSLAEATKRVDEKFEEMEMWYAQKYGDNYVSHNHGKGFAELYVQDAWDETKIFCLEYEVNRFYND